MEENAAHKKPPEALKQIFKTYQKIPLSQLNGDKNVFDLGQLQQTNDLSEVIECSWIDESEMSRVFTRFLDQSAGSKGIDAAILHNDQPILAFRPKVMPDLVIVPNMVPLYAQAEILERVFCRDLQNPTHRTNVHLHHDIVYPVGRQSFFSLDPSCQNAITPKDSSMHKEMTVDQFMNKKLRWLTLGGQYDWTRKIYPNESPPAFPSDLADLIQGLFPETTPEAAIVNLYSPGDTLSLHRDVSEDCGKGLVSLSIGCDALFVIGLENDSDTEDSSLSSLVVRLHSGDALYMSGSSRFAWHGVPRIIPDTCPLPLQNWPCSAERSDYSRRAWQGWLASKRINLNVRQMKD